MNGQIFIRLSVSAMIVAALLFMSVPGYAQSMNMQKAFDEPPTGPNPMVPLDVFVWLATSGVGVYVILSFLADKWQFFQDRPSWQKASFGIGLAIACQLAVQVAPADFWAKITPYWQSFMSIILIYFGGQGIRNVRNSDVKIFKGLR